jgi:hypothetical protein
MMKPIRTSVHNTMINAKPPFRLTAGGGGRLSIEL